MIDQAPDPGAVTAEAYGALAHSPVHVPELDGVRGVAILLVLAFHGARSVVDFGWMGVDLFFVLSGYLITIGLLKARGRAHYFRDFYIKRALRIWPLYYGLVVWAFWALPASRTGLHGADAQSFWTYALYVQNLVYPGYLAGHLSATWSLAIEEQFYLLWPLAVALLSPRGLRHLSLALVLIAPALRGVLALGGTPSAAIYELTYCRFDALAMGALLATARPLEASRVARLSVPAALVGWWAAIALALSVGSASLGSTTSPGKPLVETVLFSLVALGSVGLVSIALGSPTGPVGRILRARWLRYLGRISYGIYIYHVPIFLSVMARVTVPLGAPIPNRTKIVRLTAQLGITLAVASLSWVGLERPLLSLKSRLT